MFALLWGKFMGFLYYNIICTIVVAVLLISIAFQKIKADKTSSRFSLLAHTVLGFLVTNIFCEVVNGKSEYRVLAYILNTIDFLWVDATIIAFSAYLATIIGRISKKWERIMNPAVFFTYIRIALVIVLASFGKLFEIDENGCYQEQPLATIVYCLLFAEMLMLIIVVINNRAYFGKRQLAVMITYLALPIIGGVIEMITGYYAFTVISSTTALLLIYTMVQSGIIEDYRVRESVLEEISYTDMLTNMNNRRAYYNRFAALKQDQTVGVIFCDINGLKYTNDNFGHVAGDQLIVRFAALLALAFDTQDIFRISGDEFVVVIPEINQLTLEKRVEDFRKTIKENDSIAAVGSSYGTGCCIEQLVTVAEGAMYEDKRAYHQEHNISRGEAPCQTATSQD